MGTTAEHEKTDVEQLLLSGMPVTIFPQGYSMYPFILPGRDAVTVEPIEDKERHSVRRGDVLLYRRVDSILVLHRVHHTSGEGIFLVGDNQSEIEGPLSYEQIRGRMVSYIHRGREVRVTDMGYRVLAGLWLTMRPVRRPISLFVHKCKGIFIRHS